MMEPIEKRILNVDTDAFSFWQVAGSGSFVAVELAGTERITLLRQVHDGLESVPIGNRIEAIVLEESNGLYELGLRRIEVEARDLKDVLVQIV